MTDETGHGLPDATAPTSSGQPPAGAPEGAGLARAGAVDPQRLLRIAGVTREALEEARRIRPEPSAVDHLRRLHGQIRKELEEALPEELHDELNDLTPDVRDGSLEELALAHAEILGWLEGLFQGTQLAIQLHAARMMGDRDERRLPGHRDSEAEPDGRYL
jgi:hypothetical protein